MPTQTELAAKDPFGYGQQVEDVFPTITDPAELSKIKPGGQWRDPEGTVRHKPYEITEESQLANVPEGAHFVGPDGVTRVKPTYEGVDLTTQTLYDMAIGSHQKKSVLKRLGGEVKEGPDGLYVETEDGKRLRPGRGSFGNRAGAFVLSEIAPFGATVAGEALGAAAGTAVLPGAGTLTGAVIGGGAGAEIGVGLNQLILQLYGVDTAPPDEVTSALTEAGLWGAGGTAVGRGVEAAAPAIARGLDTAAEFVRNPGLAPNRIAAEFFGANVNPEATYTAQRLTNRGVMVPPSRWLLEAPYLRKVVEIFDPQFRMQNVLEQSAEKYYNRSANALADALGIDREGREMFTRATAKPSSEQAGAEMIARSRTELAARDQELQTKLEAARTAREAKQSAEREALAAESEQARTQLSERAHTGGMLYTQAEKELVDAAAASADAAQGAIDQGFGAIRTQLDSAVKAAETGGNSTLLWREAAGAVKELNRAVKERARKIYDSADAVAGDARPNIGTLAQDAQRFLDNLPESFQSQYPHIVKAIRDLDPALRPAPPQGVPVPPFVPPTFGQLHNLRSMLRQDIDRDALTPSIREGVYKFFANKIDKVLHDAEAVPALKEAATILDRGDKFYARNMPRFSDEMVKAVVKGVKSGMPADPEALASLIFRGNETARMREMRKILGPSLWGAVQAADTKAMLDASKTLIPGQVDAVKFAEQVLTRVQNGVLENGYSRMQARQMETLARQVMAAEGKIPLEAMPGDTVATLMGRASDYLKLADDLAKTNPLQFFERETKRVEQAFADRTKRLTEAQKAETKAGEQTEAELRAAFEAENRADPLHFLANSSAGAIRSADRILRDPDLLIAAASRFGAKSEEFTLLRQIGAMRILQRELGATARTRRYLEEAVPLEVQDILFPGIPRDAMVQLARDMEFLLKGEGDVGGSMAAASRVLHPETGFSGTAKKIIGTPIIGPTVGRFLLNKYYAAITSFVTKPGFVNWVAKGLRGDAEQRRIVRDEFQRAFGVFAETARPLAGPTGAVIGTMPEEPAEPDAALEESGKSWRQLENERRRKN